MPHSLRGNCYLCVEGLKPRNCCYSSQALPPSQWQIFVFAVFSPSKAVPDYPRGRPSTCMGTGKRRVQKNEIIWCPAVTTVTNNVAKLRLGCPSIYLFCGLVVFLFLILYLQSQPPKFSMSGGTTAHRLLFFQRETWAIIALSPIVMSLCRKVLGLQAQLWVVGAWPALQQTQLDSDMCWGNKGL